MAACKIHHVNAGDGEYSFATTSTLQVQTHFHSIKCHKCYAMRRDAKCQSFKLVSMISLIVTSTLFSNQFHLSIRISKQKMEQIVSYQAFQAPEKIENKSSSSI
ncbi:hypothetical protein P3L10_002980 [Capsicum annuum]